MLLNIYFIFELYFIKSAIKKLLYSYQLLNMKPQIKNPCFENWDAMKIGLNSRHCDNCKKDVIDFTKKNRKEIIEFFLINYNKKTCGRFYSSQLDFTHSDILITINALSKHQKNSNLPFFLLSFGTLVAINNINSQTANDKMCLFKNTTTVNITANDTVILDTATQHNELLINELIPQKFMTGIVMLSPNDTITKNEPYVLVETMPEFYGGFDSLIRYIKKNLIYPEWERKNKIQGTVYASFIVDKNGKIKNSKIIRGVENAINFNKEVLRIIDNMPDWKPGENTVEKVDVEYSLPIKFAL